MKEIIRLCEKGKFEEALVVIQQDIKAGHTTSELYRVKGQAELELGLIDTSIDTLIEALRIDPKNENALILVGNIYHKHKDDFETARRYFDKVLSLNTQNHITLNNLGGIYAFKEQYETATEFFNKALDIAPTYANAYFGKAIMALNTERYLDAFELSRKASVHASTLNSDEEKTIYSKAFQLMTQAAKEYLDQIDEAKLFLPLKGALEKRSGKPIDIAADDAITTFAKIEIAENYSREEHIVKINQDKKGYSYFVIHELMHLQLICDARDVQENEIFTSTSSNKELFIKKTAISPSFKKILRGLGDRKQGLLDQLFHGLMLQVYNAPIDLFIERLIFDNYKEVRPLQFLGLLEIAEQALKGANDKQIKEQFPHFIREANISMSVTQFKQLQEFYGIDLSRNIKEKHILKLGSKLYYQYKELAEDKKPAEEYDLIRWWAEDLGLLNYFELVLEEQDISSKESPSIEDFMDQLEQDPFNLEGDHTHEDEEMAKFINAQKGKGLNMAALMYMKGAFDHFKKLSKQQIKDIGLEIAMLGRSGIDPNKSDTYSLSSVPDQEFTGWRLLSWMYASWMDFEPDVVETFNLNLDQEYELAKKMP